jgi:2-oxoacid:acceptor oxidoreductase gamma subunit (pyruvate/2-ketoisovalerate family)
MIEIRMHGRGGQGAVSACKTIASAAYKEGKFVQSFPSFGVERRGAPVAAFTRIDDRPVLIHGEIYRPHHVVVLDASLFNSISILAGLQAGGTVLINTPLSVEYFSIPAQFRVATIDAGTIAAEHGIGTRAIPIVNTAILGAFSRFTGVVGINSIIEAIEESVPAKTRENIAATLQAYEQVHIEPLSCELMSPIS